MKGNIRKLISLGIAWALILSLVLPSNIVYADEETTDSEVVNLEITNENIDEAYSTEQVIDEDLNEENKNTDNSVENKFDEESEISAKEPADKVDEIEQNIEEKADEETKQGKSEEIKELNEEKINENTEDTGKANKEEASEGERTLDEKKPEEKDIKTESMQEDSEEIEEADFEEENADNEDVEAVLGSTSTDYYTIGVRYNQKSARSMQGLINEHRALKGKRPLYYNKELEYTAMVRAAEITRYFNASSRPNGKSWSSILYKYVSSLCSAKILISDGHSTAEDALKSWESSSSSSYLFYESYTNVGVACCEYQGVKHWVLILGGPVKYFNSRDTYLDISPLDNYNAYVTIYDSGDSTTGDYITKAYQEGWVQNGNKWWYQYADGSYAKNIWKEIGGKWYHFDAEGYMQTGWLYDGGKWYYLDASGRMQTGWVCSDGKWYYFESNGVMAVNKWIDNTFYVKSNGVMAVNEWINDKYYVGADGRWVQGKQKIVAGWKQDKTGWWYQNADGTYPRSCWKEIGGKWYHFNASGYMQTGWIQVNSYWFFLESSGAMATNKWIENKYFVKANGAMAVSEWVDGGKYYVDGNGVWVRGKTR